MLVKALSPSLSSEEATSTSCACLLSLAFTCPLHRSLGTGNIYREHETDFSHKDFLNIVLEISGRHLRLEQETSNVE